MSRKIVLSKRASKNLEKLLEYLETKWSKRVKDNFIKKLDRSLQILKEKPESSPKSDIVKGLCKCVVMKQTTVFTNLIVRICILLQSLTHDRILTS